MPTARFQNNFTEIVPGLPVSNLLKLGTPQNQMATRA